LLLFFFDRWLTLLIYFEQITDEGVTIMDFGMKNRLSRIIKPATGKTVMLAVDHGYFQGPTTGLKDLKKTVSPLIPYADCLFITRGMLRTCIDPGSDAAICLRVSGGPSILGDLSNEDLTTSLEEAIRVNASGVGMSIYVGARNEDRTISNLGRLVSEAERYGMPVLAVTAVGKEMARDARYLALACRIAAEIGAHFVKTYYCEDFYKVVEGCPVPIVMAGGKKIPEKDALQMTANAIKEGASGVDMGRNIFQSDNPVGMIQATRAVVHNGVSVKEALKIYSKK
jgi:putative autoinducer-2 (AI-2) aldolase